MSLIDKMKQAGAYRDKKAGEVLADTMTIVGKQITPPKYNFLEVLDIASQVTDFDRRSKPIPSETQITGDIILKLCSYMYERSHQNKDSKELAQELIILAARLHANIVLNEESSSNNKEEVK